MLSLTTKESIILFDMEFYSQIDGVAMGSPLGPTKCFRESVLENEDYKILRDFSIQTDHVIEARRPDLVVVDKKERSCKIIDFAVPGDSRPMHFYVITKRSG